MKSVSIISDSGVISLYFDNQIFAIETDHPNYYAIREALKNRDDNGLRKALNVKEALFELSQGRLTILGDEVSYDGQPLHNAMTERLLTLIRNQYPFEYFINFINNVMLNPSKTAVDELFLFLDTNGIPITPDGHFLAYRRVRSDYYSMHANPDGKRNRNKVGDVAEMPANQVDDKRNNLCSTGLHFCSLSYLPHYGSDSNGDKIVIVKIHPKDVRSIPSDYDNAKGRCSKYEVVAEHFEGEKVHAFKVPVYFITGEGIVEAPRNNDSNKESKVKRCVDGYFLRYCGCGEYKDYRESFNQYGLDQDDLDQLLWEIEEEFDLEVQDSLEASIYLPINYVINYYEQVLLKSGQAIK